MEPFSHRNEDGAGILRLASWEAHAGVAAGFSTRHGGVSAAPRDTLNLGLHVGDAPGDVVRNRQTLAAALGWDFAAWTCAEQVHGNRVHVVRADDRGRGRLDRESAIQEADALVTNERGVLLTMLFADCVPLYFYDPEHQAIGLAHAGWKGTVLGVAAETLRAMGREYGTEPERTLAAIGPSIGGCCYEVDEAVLRHVRPYAEQAASAGSGAGGGGTSFVVPGEDGRAALDLKELNRHLMIKAGILPTNIEMSSWCTGCRTDLFFSHRKENGATGRLTSWLGLQRG